MEKVKCAWIAAGAWCVLFTAHPGRPENDASCFGPGETDPGNRIVVTRLEQPSQNRRATTRRATSRPARQPPARKPSRKQADHESFAPSISRDGRFVAFSSYASNLLPGKPDPYCDIFVYDRTGKTLELASVTPQGQRAKGNSRAPAISADGRHVVFISEAGNLAGDAPPMSAAVYVKDRETGAIRRLDGLGAPGDALPAISGSAGVVLMSAATGVLACDPATGKFECVSRPESSSGGDGRGGDALFPAASDDGQVIVFLGASKTLVAGDTNEYWDVFVVDRRTRAYECASRAPDGTASNGQNGPPSISSDGRFVAFWSTASNLVPGDENGEPDVFVHDRKAGSTRRIAVGVAHHPGGPTPRYRRFEDLGELGRLFVSIADDGRRVAFVSPVSTLSPDRKGRIGGVFLHDFETGKTERIGPVLDEEVYAAGPERRSRYLEETVPFRAVISGDGHFVAFDSKAEDAVKNKVGQLRDVFLYDAEARRTIRISERAKPAKSGDAKEATESKEGRDDKPDSGENPPI